MGSSPLKADEQGIKTSGNNGIKVSTSSNNFSRYNTERECNSADIHVISSPGVRKGRRNNGFHQGRLHGQL